MLAPWEPALTSLGSRRIVVFGLSRFLRSDRLVLYFSVSGSEATRLSFHCPLFSTTAIDHLLYVCLENEVYKTAKGVALGE